MLHRLVEGIPTGETKTYKTDGFEELYKTYMNARGEIGIK